QAEDGIRDATVTGVQTCALPISAALFDELPLPPRVYLQELRVLCGRVRLLHEARDAGRGERDDHGRVGTFDRDPLGGAAEDPSQIGRASCRERRESAAHDAAT